MKTPILLSFLAFSSFAQAEIWMPSIFSDSMVLQRERAVVLWGEAAPGSKVQAILSGGGDMLFASAETGGDGTWKLSLEAQDAGIDHTLTVMSDGDAKVFSDVAFGEVWLASGQSNMEWPVKRIEGAEEIIAGAKSPGVRVARVVSGPEKEVRKDVTTTWQRMTPSTVHAVSGVAYTFARRLHQALGVPVGIVQSAVGGTRVEAWTPDIMPEMTGEQWKGHKGKQHVPSSLYNGKINGLVPYTISGALWYQGESNHRESDYADKLELMVTSWRKRWGKDFPFYFVQIMPFQYGDEDKEILAKFWVQNSDAEQRIKDAVMLVSGDVGDITDIHPARKTVVGRRLASIALSRDYGRGKKLPVSGPRFAGLDPAGAALKVTFKHANGLKTNDGKTPSHWEVRGGDGRWLPAEAEIKGASVMVSSAEVPAPVAVRLGWDKLVVPNLVNDAGWPTATFVAALPKPPEPKPEPVAAPAAPKPSAPAELKVAQ